MNLGFEWFGKDQHETLLRKLMHIRKHSTICDCVENAYQPHADPLYYTTKFVDDLKDGVKSFVLVQRPRDLDTAYVLAQ